MDPDGLCILVSVAAGALALAASFHAGSVCAREPERAGGSVLGFSDRAAGLAALVLIACGAFVCAAGGLVKWWAAPLLLVLIALAAACCSLGRVKGKAKEKTGVTPAVLLGFLVTAPAKLLFRALKLTAQPAVTEEDVLSFVDDVEEQDLIDESQRKMIANIFELDDVTAGDVMTHRTEVVGVNESAPAVDAMHLALRHGISRLPVYRRSLDEISGMLYVRDLFALWDEPEKMRAPVKEYMRAAMFVPESCRARQLLIDFKRKHTQIAVVVDEYGGTSGLATMEDVLEEIVGSIQDEFDSEDEDLLPTDGGFIAAGSTDLERIFDAFRVEMPDEDEDGEADFDSVGGLIVDRLGRLPMKGEDVCVEYGGLRFTVLEALERRVGRVRCERGEPATKDTDEESDRE